jgi:gamma-tubulin complex component 3
MDLISNELNKPANQLYKHSLLGILESAVRSSNAQFHDPEMLSRLEVKLLQATPGDSGWDIFSLDYRVDCPLSTILTPDVMKEYLRIFNFLWRLKRVDHSLSTTWSQHMTSKFQLSSLRDIREDLHRCNLLRHEMVHFITNIHNYLMVEVLESSWKVFIVAKCKRS